MGESSCSSCLKQAVLLLQELSEKKQNLKPAVKIFADCHFICLKQGDADGFLWSTKLLQGVINHFSSEDLEPDSLSVFLLECFANSQQEEDPQALAAFHVATRHQEKALFTSCLDSARSDLLRYHAAMGLGSIIHQDDGEGALKCFQVAKSTAEALDVEYRAIASYWMMKTLSQLGELQEAKIALDQVFTGSVISSALASMIKAKIKQKEGGDWKEVVSVYAEARRTLANFMVNLKDKLAEKLASSCCSTLFLLNHVRYDRFTKFFILTLPSPDLAALATATPLNVCFAAYDLYREARCEIAELQEGRVDAEDARSHIEEGIEVMYDRYDEVSVTGIDPLVLGHQIALKMGDLDSIHWAQVFINDYLGRETKGDTQAMLSRLMVCVEKHSRDGETYGAWTDYYIGRGGVLDGKFSKAQYGFLERSLEQAETGMLRYFAATELGNACTDQKTSREYLERAKRYALQASNEELILDAMARQFDALISQQLFEMANGIVQELRKVTDRSFSNLVVFGQGVVELMEGRLKREWGDVSGAALHFQRSCQLLEPLQTPYPAALVTYICNRDTPSFFGRNRLQMSFGDAVVLLKACNENLQMGAATGITLYDEATMELKEILKLLIKLDEEGDLEEQESQIGHLLQTLTRENRDVELHGLQIYESRLWMKMAELAHAYSIKLRISPPLLLVNEFMRQAIQLAERSISPSVTVPSVLVNHACLLFKMGFTTDSIQKIKELLRYWLKMDGIFGCLSIGRINNIESLMLYFKGLQMFLLEANDIKQALIWSDRSHARDMLFLVSKEGDRENSMEFDMDDDRAWSEIEEVSKIMGKETAILIVSKISISTFDNVVIYLLHNGELINYRHQRGFQACSPSDLLKLLNPNDVDSNDRDSNDVDSNDRDSNDVDSNDRDSNDVDSILRDYYKIIIEPFELQLESIQPKKLVFVPSEDISFVPFGALIDEDNNYLIQRYAVATVSSLRLLNHCDKRRRALRQQKQKSQTSSSLVVGNPSKDLDYATKEAEMVESFLKRANAESVVNLLCEADATKDLVLQQLPESDWIHIASHGTVTADFPDGALVFAVPEEHRDDLAKSARSSEFEECLVRALTTASVSDRLTGDEVVELAGQGPFRASAAILSACNSGIGRVFAEGILALPRSFHISGVPSVVISLWRVNDESTQVLMEKMYGNLVEEGMDIGSALQKASVEMIEEIYNVRHWAAFFISGSPFTTLKIPKF
ncbi:hypothetical protein SELMODRAFT_413534 [Selaginella moellendorffii]|uniref:CHAT domain-containing protein n=1 Tax=Selaginella moellendorffii TaxID=88036 RepID=D8RQK6_SELML|nr:hypothetical protein SELMODRAFT_413534 [Selaginella moellendorffii]